jgi:hypothetical protein
MLKLGEEYTQETLVIILFKNQFSTSKKTCQLFCTVQTWSPTKTEEHEL